MCVSNKAATQREVSVSKDTWTRNQEVFSKEKKKTKKQVAWSDNSESKIFIILYKSSKWPRRIKMSYF